MGGAASKPGQAAEPRLRSRYSRRASSNSPWYVCSSAATCGVVATAFQAQGRRARGAPQGLVAAAGARACLRAGVAPPGLCIRASTAGSGGRQPGVERQCGRRRRTSLQAHGTPPHLRSAACARCRRPGASAAPPPVAAGGLHAHTKKVVPSWTECHRMLGRQQWRQHAPAGDRRKELSTMSYEPSRRRGDSASGKQGPVDMGVSGARTAQLGWWAGAYPWAGGAPAPAAAAAAQRCRPSAPRRRRCPAGSQVRNSCGASKPGASHKADQQASLRRRPRQAACALTFSRRGHSSAASAKAPRATRACRYCSLSASRASARTAAAAAAAPGLRSGVAWRSARQA